MLDPQLLRKDLESVKTRLATRKFELDTALFKQLETERKELQGRTEELQAKRNQLAKAIGMKKGKGEKWTFMRKFKTPVNGGCNSDGPKVAKCLGG